MECWVGDVLLLHITDSSLLLFRGSAELLEESGGNVSPAESMTSIPTCMPFSWKGNKDRDKDREREREREPSSSSSSLPYAATETSSEQSQERRNKVSAFTPPRPPKGPPHVQSNQELLELRGSEM